MTDEKITVGDLLLRLSSEDDFLSQFARIWIETHFPLESSIVTFC